MSSTNQLNNHEMQRSVSFYLIQWNLGPRSLAVVLLPLLATRAVRGKYTSPLLASAGQRQKVEEEHIVTLE